MESNEVDDFDPTVLMAMQQQIKHASVGKTPSGFAKIHAELLPLDLMKVVGYDPRAIQEKPRRGKDPQNISPEVIDLRRKVQRSIDPEKVAAMVEYLRNAVLSGRFADWAEIDVVTAAKPDTSTYQETSTVVFPQSADYFITDGQHRYCAILDFVREYTDHANAFTQAIAISVLPHSRLAEWAGQSFHDKNHLATPVKMTKALAVDMRDLHNRLTKDLWAHPVVRSGGGVNAEKDALQATAREFATHAVLFKFTRAFCEGRQGLDRGTLSNTALTDDTYETLKKSLFEYLTELDRVLPNWTVVPGREVYLFRSSAALQAFGVLGKYLYGKVDDPAERRRMIEGMGERALDWRRSNQEWSGVIGQVKPDGAVSPASSRQAIDGTIKLLKERSGLDRHLTAPLP